MPGHRYLLLELLCFYVAGPVIQMYRIAAPMMKWLLFGKISCQQSFSPSIGMRFQFLNMSYMCPHWPLWWERFKICLWAMDECTYKEQAKLLHLAVYCWMTTTPSNVVLQQSNVLMLLWCSFLLIVQDSSVISIGSVKLHFIHTPGHTPGSQCIHIQG